MPKTLSHQFARRTLARMTMLTEVDKKQFAAAMSEMKIARTYLYSIGRWLQEIASLMPQTSSCAECGEEMTVVILENTKLLKYRADARYCSRKCRQRAYRKRVTEHTHPKKTSRNKSTSSETGERVSRNGALASAVEIVNA